MSSQLLSNVYIALIHYPVYNKHRETVKTWLTTLDLHDIARAGRTFGIKAFYFINTLASQRELAQTIFDHWHSGWGATYNPNRKEALDLTRIAPDLEGALRAIEQESGLPVKTIVTGARIANPDLDYREFRLLAEKKEEALVLLFGTGWGLVEETIQNAHYRLSPITGGGDYTHLSVRSAVSIILDRVLHGRE